MLTSYDALILWSLPKPPKQYVKIVGRLLIYFLIYADWSTQKTAQIWSVELNDFAHGMQEELLNMLVRLLENKGLTVPRVMLTKKHLSKT
jgi:hypothetical protein